MALDAESKRQLVLHRAELSAHLASSPQLRTSSPAAIGAGKTGAVSCCPRWVVQSGGPWAVGRELHERRETRPLNRPTLCVDTRSMRPKPQDVVG